jgi:hypothetical protein
MTDAAYLASAARGKTTAAAFLFLALSTLAALRVARARLAFLVLANAAITFLVVAVETISALGIRAAFIPAKAGNELPAIGNGRPPLVVQVGIAILAAAGRVGDTGAKTRLINDAAAGATGVAGALLVTHTAFREASTLVPTVGG